MAIFVQWDSFWPGLPGTFHASFKPLDEHGNERTGLPTRQSLETRWLVLLDWPKEVRHQKLAEYNAACQRQHGPAWIHWTEDYDPLTFQRRWRQGPAGSITYDAPWVARP
jgi:hypothetical protein